MFTNMDNIFVAWKRQKNDKVVYRRLTELEYKNEFLSGFSFALNFKHQIEEATPWLPFIDGYGNWYKNYTQASINLTLRYAPG